MRSTMRSLLSLAAACLLVSCGSSDSPSAPTAAAVTFTGNYAGTYIVSSCSEGQLTGLCSGFPIGTTFPVHLTLGQTGSAVSGTIMLGSLNGTFQGVANGSGLAGTASMGNIVALGVTTIPNVTAWSSTLNGNAMTGNFTITLAVSGFAGATTINASLSQLSR